MNTNVSDLNPQQAFDLTDRVAIVTGGAGDIGEGIATVLAQAGAHVVVADLGEAAAREAADRLTDGGFRAEAAVLDVSRKADFDALVDDVMARHGRLDVLVNNAGIMTDRPALEMSEEEFDRVLGVNLKGVLFGCQAAGRVMGAGGSIINIASSIIDTPAPGRMAYGAAKAGVTHVTWSFAQELGAQGVRVNTVVPGWIESGITRRHFTSADGVVDEEKREALLGSMKKISPLGRIGAPVDVAMPVLFLAGDGARHVTGQALRANGGSSMR